MFIGPYIDGSKLGQGYCSLTDDLKLTALSDESIKKVTYSGSNFGDSQDPNQSSKILNREVITEFKVIQSNEDLQKSLNIGISGSFDANNLIHRGSVSGKLELVDSYNSSENSSCVLIKIRLINQRYNIKFPEIKEEIVQDLRDRGKEQDTIVRFRRQFGDSFVSGFTTGGEYVAVIQDKSSESSDSFSLLGKVKAQYESPVVNVGGEGSVGREKISDSGNRNYQITTYRTGGQLKLFPMNLKEVFDDIEKFIDNNANSPSQFIYTEYQSYDTILAGINELDMQIESVHYSLLKSAINTLNFKMLEQQKIINQLRENQPKNGEINSNRIEELIKMQARYNEMEFMRTRIIYEPTLLENEDHEKEMYELMPLMPGSEQESESEQKNLPSTSNTST